MKRTKAVKADTKEETPASKAPPLLLAVAWLLPGVGHWILGKRVRAIVFAVIIVSSFVTGILLDGDIGTPRPGEPFTFLAAFACIGNGLLYFIRLIWLNGLHGIFTSTFPFGLDGGGDPVAAGFNFGNTFLYTAGLMNLLTVLDVSDIARGEKG